MDAVIIFGVALIPSLLILAAAVVQYFLWNQEQKDDNNDDDEGDRAEQWQDAAYAPLEGRIDPIGVDDESQTLQRCNPSR